MDPTSLTKLNEARRARRAVILLTEMESGRDRVIAEGDPVAGNLAENVEKAFLSGKSATVEIEGKPCFLNVHVPPPRIVVIGAVHITQALATIAQVAGYELSIIDPRTAFATPERFANVDLKPEWPQDVLPHHPLDSYTALVAVTHDPKIDDFPIVEALKANCFYVGALGSRKTHGKRLERLQAEGLSAQQLSRIHAPIGVDIGASSPPEIAVAIMAEIIGAYRRRELLSASRQGTAA